MAPQKTAPPIVDTAFFATIDDELHDSARVQRHGQEEDLREALSRVIRRVQELCGLLKASCQTKSDLETQLTLAQSNLKMSIANNEMLEDALKRHSASKDVGWRRAPVHRTSIDENSSEEAHLNGDPPPPTPPPNQTSAADTRFFRFRFSGGRASQIQSPSPSTPSPAVARTSTSSSGHLTSASLPSLVHPLDEAYARELEEFRAKLAEETSRLAKAVDEKRALESELETLSQALFEEANKMVASERIKRAEAEEELKEARQEKDALRAAMKLMESERSAAELLPLSAGETYAVTSAASEPKARSHSSLSHSSSVSAIKSPPLSPSGSHTEDYSNMSTEDTIHDTSADGDTLLLSGIPSHALESQAQPKSEPSTALITDSSPQAPNSNSPTSTDSSPWLQAATSAPESSVSFSPPPAEELDSPWR